MSAGLSPSCLCVKQRVKPYQTSHHYKPIPKPQEGLHNGQCVVGVTQASPSTPVLTVSNESTQENLSTRPGPKEMYVLTMSGMTTPPPRLARNRNSYLPLSLIPIIPPTKHIVWFLYGALHKVRGLLHLLPLCTFVHIDKCLLCMLVFPISLFFYRTHIQTMRPRHKSI